MAERLSYRDRKDLINLSGPIYCAETSLDSVHKRKGKAMVDSPDVNHSSLMPAECDSEFCPFTAVGKCAAK